MSVQNAASRLDDRFAIDRVTPISVSAPTLYRIAAASGIGGALILLVNAAKRSSLIATTDATQLVAPLAEIFALGLIVALFLGFGRRAGIFGTVAFVLNFIALASLEGVEVVINLVFSKLPPNVIADLRAGPLGIALISSSILFLLASLMFVTSLFVAKDVPRGPLALYAMGVVPIALRASVPELALDLGLVMLAAAIAWLSGWLWTHADTIGVQSN
jgi:NADPH:quinone reductase-like Zn-dependent oxidoreductase